MPPIVGHVRDTADPKQPTYWASLINQLIDQLGSRAEVARRVGVSPRQVGRWADGSTTNVTSHSMRLVARALHLSDEEVALGVVGAQAERHRADDRLIAYVKASDEHAEDEKQKIIDYIVSEREKTEASLIAAVELMLQPRREAS